MGGWRYGLQALKSAIEPICLTQKPLDGNANENWRTRGVDGMNIDACRIDIATGDQKSEGGPNTGMSGGAFFGKTKTSGNNRDGVGRRPANLCHDGSDKVMGAFAALGVK